MRRNGIYFFLLVLVALSVSVGCKKKVFDYRKKYTGDFHFVWTHYSWDITPYQSPTVTEEYDGRIYIDEEEDEDRIFLEYVNGGGMLVAIDKDGNLTTCGGEGKFDNRDQLSFSWASAACPGGGLGGGVVYTITAKRR